MQIIAVVELISTNFHSKTDILRETPGKKTLETSV